MTQNSSNTVAFDSMEVLQVQMLAIHLADCAKHDNCIGVSPKQVRFTANHWFHKVGHEGFGPRAKWKAISDEFHRVFEILIKE